jgi:hypothetical protein
MGLASVDRTAVRPDKPEGHFRGLTLTKRSQHQNPSHYKALSNIHTNADVEYRQNIMSVIGGCK